MTIKANDEHMAKMREIATERAFQRLVRKLARQVIQLQTMGEKDMGLLHDRLAGRFHKATAELRALTIDLTQSSMWPHEPGFPE